MTARPEAPIRHGVVRAGQYLLVALALLAALGPTLWAVMSSFKTTRQILDFIIGPPIPPTVDGYIDAFTTVPLGTALANQVIYASLAGILTPVLALMLAYPCARLTFPFRNLVVVAVSASITIPGICLVVPEFFIMLRTGLLDTKHGMIVFYVAAFLPIAFILLRAFLLSIPKEVEEAAAIDGAGYWRVLFQIVARLASPILITVFVLVFIFVWNDFFWNLVFAPSYENLNAQVLLATFRGAWEFNIAALLAGATLVAIIPVTIFLFAQKYALAGLMASAGSGARARKNA